MNVADVVPEQIRPLLRAEYERLVETGAFASERVELLDGVLVTMTPQDPAHAYCVQRLAETLMLVLSGRALVRIQSPLALLDDAEPEPDVAVVPFGDYSLQHPTAAHLVVEVAGASLKRDRLVKGPIYARAGVEEYWLVDLSARIVEVHQHSDGVRFSGLMRLTEGQRLRPVHFPEVEIPLVQILPTARR